MLRADRFFERRVPPVRPVTEAAKLTATQVMMPITQQATKQVTATATSRPKPKTAPRTVPKPKQPSTAQTPLVPGSIGAVIAYALAQQGKPYVWAAAGPNSFDCSGLVVASYARAGISLPHQTGGLIGRGRSVSRAELQPGDLVFPSSGHVAIYLGDGMMIHAPHTGDHVRIAKVYAFYAGRRIIG